jgi:pimeloyl-ACP methyl ester carboxylesterase
MHAVRSGEATISYTKAGSGPPIVLVHGSLSDQETNWAAVRPHFERRFTVHAVARRGRGQTSKTSGHSVQDEANDIAAVVAAAGKGVSLLGHSYGAVCALAATLQSPSVERLILYEPPKPSAMPMSMLTRLENVGERGEWDAMVELFMIEVLQVPPEGVRELRQMPMWGEMVSDAEASLADWRALAAYDAEPRQFRSLRVPVLLLVGSESPAELYQTDDLAKVLPDSRTVVFDGQEHEAMSTAPEIFVREVEKFLLGS